MLSTCGSRERPKRRARVGSRDRTNLEGTSAHAAPVTRRLLRPYVRLVNYFLNPFRSTALHSAAECRTRSALFTRARAMHSAQPWPTVNGSMGKSAAHFIITAAAQSVQDHRRASPPQTLLADGRPHPHSAPAEQTQHARRSRYLRRCSPKRADLRAHMR